MKNLKGSILITSPNANVPPYEWVEIKIEDELSQTIVVKATMTFEAFGKAITNNSDQPCKFELNTSGLVGKKREHKTEIVPIPESETSPVELKKILAPFEVDGWQAHDSDLTNHHNFTRNGVRVIFERWV